MPSSCAAYTRCCTDARRVVWDELRHVAVVKTTTALSTRSIACRTVPGRSSAITEPHMSRLTVPRDPCSGAILAVAYQRLAGAKDERPGRSHCSGWGSRSDE